MTKTVLIILDKNINWQEKQRAYCFWLLFDYKDIYEQLTVDNER